MLKIQQRVVSSKEFNLISNMIKRSDSYLHSSAMNATSSSLALASTILGFEIVELWYEDQSENKFKCTYVHASEETLSKYPNIISGHYPCHKREHRLSPKLCELALKSTNRCHWRVINSKSTDKSLLSEIKCPSGSEYDGIEFNVATEMAYLLDGETGGLNVFIVALSSQIIEFKNTKLKFLSGLAYAIYVAAFDIDGEDADNNKETSDELDMKAFLPSKPIVASNSNPNFEKQFNLDGNKGFDQQINFADQESPIVKHAYVNIKKEPTLIRNQSIEQFELRNENSVNKSNEITRPMSTSYHQSLLMTALSHHSVNSNQNSNIMSKEGSQQASNTLDNAMKNEEFQEESIPVQTAITDNQQYATIPTPTWDPSESFSYPVAEVPIKQVFSDNLTLEDFSDIKHVGDGSNSNVYSAKYKKDKVVIKIIKIESENDRVALHEFDLEHGMLSRFSHPNIIKILGAGRIPRRFIVLEWLGGGTLSSILMNNQSKPGLANKLFRKPSFTYASLLSRARDIADAFDYLHSRCHPGASIIHRDLKPDNVGFTSDGTLKLFDFGLVACVKARQSSDEAYKMTGYTGSLRYMAPEVALRKSYTEKVDVYSFGIMLWQMATDKVPFKGFNKDEFMVHVVRDGYRPKVDPNWPPQFTDLLKRCWDSNATIRPSFSEIANEIDFWQQSLNTKYSSSSSIPKAIVSSSSSTSNSSTQNDSSVSKNRKPLNIINTKSKSSSYSSWF